MVQNLSSGSFPRIPRQNENLVNGWGTLVNKNGREGSEPIIREAFTIKLDRDEVKTDEGPEQHDVLGDGPECG